ncbi:MAG: FGGY-family carbohydrate kinase, partial [Actinomycetota bacterium]
FNYFLTGESFNEFTNASTTSMLSQVDKNWEKEIIKKLRINPKIFCEIIKPGTEISKINSQLKSELDIKDMKVVAPATHDTASAIAGIPIKEFSKKWAYISMGTWCILGFECENTIINADAMKKGFFNEGGAEGKNLYNKNIVGLWTIQQCMERWIKEKNEHFQWSDLDKIFPFCKEFNSFIDIEDPIFILPNSNMPKTIVDYCKDNNLNIPNNIGEIARCFYESLVFKFRYYFEYLQKFIDEKIEILYMVGEGTKNNYLCQWCSNLNKIPVVASPTQTTAMGNALMQLKSCGEINNLEEGRLISYNSLETAYYTPEDIEKWEEGYQKYLNFLKQ